MSRIAEVRAAELAQQIVALRRQVEAQAVELATVCSQAASTA